MFDDQIAVNQFLLAQFDKISADIPEDGLFQPAAGHGHPPVWILGHLALVGEFGQQMLGGSVAHPEWIRLFGPGSSDQIAPTPTLTRAMFQSGIPAIYGELQRLARAADPQRVAQPHGLAIFAGSPITTVSHCITLMLTNHFGFHLAQLSSCRRALGHKALF